MGAVNWELKINDSKNRQWFGYIIWQLVLLFLSLCLAYAEPAPQSSSFSEQYNRAINAANDGDLHLAYSLFEDLLKQHPGEILIYDTYATICESHGNYRRAIQIYKRWALAHGLESQSPISVSARISELENRIKNEKLFAQALPWGEAKVSGNQFFTFVTNVPEPYASAMSKNILELMDKEEQILEKIFGYPLPEERPLKIFLTAHSQEYWDLIMEKSRDIGLSSAAYYFSEYQEIVISSVAMTKAAVAHELGHHLIHTYIKNPSMLIDEGLASYLEMKLGKETAKTQLLNYIETLNYLYDQGQWENFLGLIPAWQDFLADYLARGLLRYNSYTSFYMRAWTTVSFFAETEDAFFHQFFRDYLDYEKNREVNTWETFQKYFMSHLTRDQLKALDEKWGRYTVNLTYEKV